MSRKACLWTLFALVAAGAALAAWRLMRPPRIADETDPHPPPPYSVSRHLNTAPDVAYVGSAVCAGCHRTQHASYLRTPHSRALSDLDPGAEPADATFAHAASGRTYRTYRAEGQMRHEETLRAEGGREIARVDLPIRYLIGSGHFTRSYLVEVDGFLHESPITWYASKQKWDLSPGYDSAKHFSFERPARVGCLFCHAGRVEAGEGAHKVVLREKAIGCESCHGPGALHQQFHASNKLAPGEEDLTIVHPGKVSRELQEAICASCHLSGATALHRGRSVTDFRPGRPLSDFRTDYRFEADDDRMSVVGHVEQLRLSACYQKSGTMTCLTCHDPHQRQAHADPVAAHRRQCLGCHEKKPCGFDETARRKKEPKDNCVACHMPRGDTDIIHVAFTHHRIGHHGAAKRPAASAVPRLVPVGDVSHLSEADRQRNLGLAYLLAMRDRGRAALAKPLAAAARTHLESAYDAGLRDVATTQALAELTWKQDADRAAAYAREAVAAKDGRPGTRYAARFLLANEEYRGDNLASAAEHLRELTAERRDAEDWRLRGVIHLREGETAEALAALRRALAIRPFRHTTHLALAEAYRRSGDAERAREHDSKARWLRERGQD